MPKLTETPGSGHFIVSEANGHRSRQRRTFAAGQSLKAGQVYGVITSTGHAVALAPAASDGSQTAAGIAYADIHPDTNPVEGVGIERDAEIAKVRLFWPAAIDAPKQAAALTQLAALGILARA